jgi:hypothetical protein
MVIDNVPRLDASGVREGRAVSGVNSYSIYLEAVSEGLSEATSPTLKIWNVPGMSVNKDNQAIEVNSATGDNDETDGNISLENMALNNANKTYVLTNDITLIGGWTPVGTDTAPFWGKFYGAGRRITVAGDPANTAYTGIFGYASGAEIRDLSVYYAANVSVGADATHIGGLAGYADGGTTIRNVLVSGAGTLIYNTGSKAYYTGGLAGYLDGGASQIENCYGSLNLKVSAATGGFIRAGGIAGHIDTASLKDCVWTGTLEFSNPVAGYVGGIAGQFVSTAVISPAPSVRNAAARGTITAASDWVVVGGLIGETHAASASVTPPLIAASYYEGGSIKVDSSGGAGPTVGGLFGGIGSDALTHTNSVGSDIQSCWSRAAGITVSKAGTGGVSLGGFAGAVRDTTIEGCFSESPLTLTEAPEAGSISAGGFIGNMYTSDNNTTSIISCHAGAAINVTGRVPFVGGLIGYIYAGSGANNSIEKSYATGNITTAASYASSTGGLTGYTDNTTIKESWASGSVRAGGRPGITLGIDSGGLTGDLTGNSKIENCYALGDVFADNPYSAAVVYVGGLVGYLNSTTSGVYYSFAGGSATAQTNSGSGVYAGGLVGYRASGDIQRCAALGETVTARGSSSNKAATRVYGYAVSSIGMGNYALNVMYLETWNTYRNGTANPLTPTSDAAGPDGADAAPGTLGTATFWTTTMDFNTCVWNMSGVARGYPKLAWE